MIKALNDQELFVVGYGESRVTYGNRTNNESPRVRYIDPFAWTVLGAVEQAVERSINFHHIESNKVGTILVSDCGPAQTIAHISREVSSGYVSPLRFAAASPGSLLGFTCLMLGFSGPTMNFITSPVESITPALILAELWLKGKEVTTISISTLSCDPNYIPVARSLLLCSTNGITPFHIGSNNFRQWLQFESENLP